MRNGRSARTRYCKRILRLLRPASGEAGRSRRLQRAIAMTVPTSKDRVIEVRPPERIVRAEPGPRRLFILMGEKESCVEVVRHWKDGQTVPCDCEGPCPTARNDWFAPALLLHHVTSDTTRWWEPVVLHMTDDAVRRLEAAVQIAGVMPGLTGLMFRLGREGSSKQSRIIVTEVSKIGHPPTYHTSVGTVLAMRRVAGYTPLFQSRPGPAEEDQVIPPARSRADKPRVPKGKKD